MSQRRTDQPDRQSRNQSWFYQALCSGLFSRSASKSEIGICCQSWGSPVPYDALLERDQQAASFPRCEIGFGCWCLRQTRGLHTAAGIMPMRSCNTVLSRRF
jgi:hypothetical protein